MGNIGLRGQNNVPQARIGVFWPDLGHFAWIWAIMLGFGPFCLDLGHIAWIWAIWQNRRMDGRTDSPCVLQDFVPFGAAALLPLNLNHTQLKQGTGTADHLLPLGCYSLLYVYLFILLSVYLSV